MSRGLLLTTVGAVAVSLIGTCALLGLPGAIIFEASSPLLRAVFGSDALEKLPADSYWPIAIYISLLWPLSLIAGYFIAFRALPTLARGGRILLFMGVLGLWATLLSTAGYLLGRQS